MTLIPKLDFRKAYQRIEGVVNRTPLQFNQHLSQEFDAEVYLKREDLQLVRSYKLRGAFNKMASLSEVELGHGITCASAGNHAQGVAYSCKILNIPGVIFMPTPTPRQKIAQTKMWGGDNIEIVLVGDTFDDCLVAALAYNQQHGMTFISPFDDIKVIEGQGTVGLEILEDLPELDAVIIPIGGGGLSSGICSFMNEQAPHVKLFGVEPEGAPSMVAALKNNGPIELESISKFVDGAAVKKVGNLTFQISSQLLDSVKLVPEGKICTTILQLYNRDAIIAEPAGAMSIAALELHRQEIFGKKVVCILSGGNNDIDRMGEIKEMSLLYEGVKHYFIVRFPQRPGALRLLVTDVLGPKDDITRFEYIKKTERESGPALVGIELGNPLEYTNLISRMHGYGFDFIEVNKGQTLFEYLV